MMKRVILILLLGWMVSEVYATTDSLFMTANAQYQDGNYESALNTYREITGSGLESADLYYNMGNAAFRSNNIGYAILYYEKALKLDPTHENARHNLAFVSQYRVDAFEEVPELFIRTWTQALMNSLSEHSWSMLALIFFLLILASLLIYLFSRKLGIKKAGFIISLASLLLFAVTLSAALSLHRKIIRPDDAIIIAPSVTVRSSPSESGTELFILHEGTKVKINEEVSGWQNIRVVDGREGWITAGDFESI